MKKLPLISLVIFVSSLASACQSEGENLKLVEFYSANNPKEMIASFKAEIADEPQEISLGLMYRQELEQDHGMLFIFENEVMSSFWMKNTLIALDMIFISQDKKVISIVHEAEPQTTSPRLASAPFKYVLEINGGLANKFGILPGDSVLFE